MAWVESHEDLATHPKTRRLMRALGIELPTAIGYLHLLWWWALRHADDGDLSRYSNADIADGIGWPGDPEELVAALTSSGFLDADRCIHDWWEYAGRLIEQRRRDRERKGRTRRPPGDGAARSSTLAPSPSPGNSGTPSDVRLNSERCPAEFRRTSAGIPPDGGRIPGVTLTGTGPVPEPEPDLVPDPGREDQPSRVLPPGSGGGCGGNHAAAAAAAPPEDAPAGKPRAGGTKRPNRVAEVVDLLKAAGVPVAVTPRDGKAIRECGAAPALIAEAYAAAYRGEWGDDWLQANLSLHLVVARLAGYEAWRRNGSRGRARDSPRDAPAAEPDEFSPELRSVLAQMHGRQIWRPEDYRPEASDQG